MKVTETDVISRMESERRGDQGRIDCRWDWDWDWDCAAVMVGCLATASDPNMIVRVWWPHSSVLSAQRSRFNRLRRFDTRTLYRE